MQFLSYFMCLESLLQPLRCILSITRETADNTAILYWKISNLSVMCMLVRKGIFPAMSVNKDVTVISDSSPPTWVPNPKGTQEGEVLRPLPADCSHSLLQAPSNSGWDRERYWPQIAEMGVKGWYQWTRTPASSHTWKAKVLKLGYLISFN